MQTQRPVNLDLTTIRLPITAIVSILHRISGVLLFFCIPLLLCALNTSLESEAGFAQVKNWLEQPVARFINWAIFSGLFYHLIAGIRHLLMDMHIGETKKGGKQGSYIVLAITFVVVAMYGACIW